MSFSGDSATPATLTTDQLFQQAFSHHQAGHLQDAERLYRAVLQVQPKHPDANYGLGKLAMQINQPVAGVGLFKVALETNPNQRLYWISYIDGLFQIDRVDLAQQVLAIARQRGLQGPDVDALAVRLTGKPETKPLPKHKPGKPSKPAKASNKKTQAKKGAAPNPQEQAALITLFNQGISQGRYSEAEVYARTMTASYPQYGFGWKVLAATLCQQGKNTEALPAMQTAVALLPGDAELYMHLGNLLNTLHKPTESEASYRRALAIKPDFFMVHNNLGIILHEQERQAEAEACFLKALELKPDYFEAHGNLANTLKSLGRLAEAEASYHRALEINPNFIEAYNNLGNMLKDQRRLSESEDSFRRALEIKPDAAEIYSNLGVVLNDQSRLAESEACYQRALEIRPEYTEAHSNWLFSMNYTASHTPAFCLDVARQYGQKISAKVKAPFSNWRCVAQPERLRVGLVSGDLSSHPVGYFLEGLLSHINPAKVELIVYPTNLRSDKLTARIKPYFSAWKPLHGLPDEAAARLIHADAVHVLIDLSGHSAQNRLPVFAWKPAPVQVSWLGYFATTGVAEIDYLLADEVGVPEQQRDQFTEQVWYLPDTRLCFSVPEVDMPVAPLPAKTVGNVTFGCFQSLSKVGDDVLTVWAKVMAAIPGSRLRMQCRQLGDASVLESFNQRLQQHGIDQARVLTFGLVPRETYMASHAEVDFILDTFPYPGGTTTCEALWMGVPTLTLAGGNLIARQGASLLTAAGLADWVTHDKEEYIAKAIHFANDIEGLATLRAGLRQQVLASPVFDAALFAGRLETALWEMWRKYVGVT